jgi:hypothetical protein
MKTMIEFLRAKSHARGTQIHCQDQGTPGEPQNEEADTVAERAPQLPEDSKQWTTRTPRLLYEWTD